MSSKKVFTRWIERQYEVIKNEKYVYVVSDSGKETLMPSMECILNANDFLVKRYFDLNDQQIEDMSSKEYKEKLLEAKNAMGK
jgi:hypothetical protein